MSETYEDYQQEYKSYLARIRSCLAGARNHANLTESERLLKEAKRCASAMLGLAEVQDNSLRVQEAKHVLERDIAPLAKEVRRALNELVGRNELLYQAPDIEMNNTDMDYLIQNSEDLLRETQSILAETEHIGTSTLHQMGRQREQLRNTNQHLEGVRDVALQAKRILGSMSVKALKTRVGLYFMIGLMAFVNLWVLHMIYKKHHPTSSGKGSVP
jgi:vesicle transport through interaction with t-SNAREs protein 1